MNLARLRHNIFLPFVLLLLVSFSFNSEINSTQQIPVSCNLFSNIEYHIEDGFTLINSSISPEIYSQFKTSNYSDNNFSNESLLSINNLHLKGIKRSALKNAIRSIKI